jgi:predicted transcriptional regulator
MQSSKSSKKRKHRSRLEIASQILKLCKSAQGITRIMRHLNLSYGQTRVMLDFLLLRGFLEERMRGEYIITDFGKEFAGCLKTVFEVWNVPQFILHGPCHIDSLSFPD